LNAKASTESARQTGSDASRSFDTGPTSRHLSLFLNGVIIGALAVHIAVYCIVANKASSPWSGGGDTGIYINLAQNISVGRGYALGGTPTAFRAPFYPLLLAEFMVLWPSRWPLLLRTIQLCATLCTAAICGALAKKWGGQGRVAFLFGLLMPTLLFFQTEILTESVAAMLVALWWFYLCESFERREQFPAVLAGICAGVVSLERFNAAPLVLLGPVFVYLVYRDHKRALLTLGAGCVIVAPWVVHNWRAFGQPLYSTHTGFALVEGVLSPTGRGDSGEIAAMRNKLGWYNADVESDSAPPKLRDELSLDAQARRLARALWAHQGFTDLLKLATIKLGAFWFSTDQIFATTTFSLEVRILRWGGVGVYWIFVTLAVVGWFCLCRTNSATAWLLLAFAVLITALHLPLTMNTRLRVPFFDPLIVALAAVGVSALKSGRAVRAQFQPPSDTPDSIKPLAHRITRTARALFAGCIYSDSTDVGWGDSGDHSRRRRPSEAERNGFPVNRPL
jgi:hypothetical protein